MIQKFRKKPVIIEAVEWKGNNPMEICNFLGSENISSMKEGDNFFWIKTLEGDMRANKGDWIIKGVAGEFYPCKSDIFNKTYEEVSQ